MAMDRFDWRVLKERVEILKDSIRRRDWTSTDFELKRLERWIDAHDERRIEEDEETG